MKGEDSELAKAVRKLDRKESSSPNLAMTISSFGFGYGMCLDSGLTFPAA